MRENECSLGTAPPALHACMTRMMQGMLAMRNKEAGTSEKMAGNEGEMKGKRELNGSEGKRKEMKRANEMKGHGKT